MHILSASQFTPEDLGEIFERADFFSAELETTEGRRRLATIHQGEHIGSIFYEASTRTKASFELAAMKLGMGVFGTENAGEFSSIAKGESIEHTVQVLGGYGLAAIVLRTKEEGLAARAASASPVPILNAGDGKGEHPTQGILDAYTIQKLLGRLDHLNIGICGDLARGRTARTLAQLLAKYPGNHITFTSIPALKMGEDVKQTLREHGTSFTETSNMYEGLRNADVFYMTRTQNERDVSIDDDLSDEEREKAEELKRQQIAYDGKLVINQAAMEVLPEHAILLHPLPIKDEIAREVDNDPRAVYISKQSPTGVPIRMVLLDQAVMRLR
jgi:aspartate carbamoyltransferase catalytic subunit